MISIDIKKEVWKGFIIRLPDDLKKRLRKQAKENNLTMAEQIRKILERELK